MTRICAVAVERTRPLVPSRMHRSRLAMQGGPLAPDISQNSQRYFLRCPCRYLSPFSPEFSVSLQVLFTSINVPWQAVHRIFEPVHFFFREPDVVKHFGWHRKE